MERYRKLFTQFPSVLGMIHVLPLPGTPRYNPRMNVNRIVDKAKEEAETYAKAGIDGVLIENMNDIPYLNRTVGPEITAAMTSVACAVKSILPDVPCGIQILAGCNKEAIAVAKASNLDFIRAECFLFSQISDEGLMNSDAGDLLRYRKSIDADDVLVFTDIKKKHCSHYITSDIDIGETCRAAEFFLSDGVVITGTATGSPASRDDILNAKQSCTLPVLIGSGVTRENVIGYMNADVLIVGSSFKHGGYWANDISEKRVNDFMSTVQSLRESYT